MLCSAVGLDTSTGKLKLEPATLQGRTCRVRVEIEEYEDRFGEKRRRNTLPFAAFAPAEEGDEADEGPARPHVLKDSGEEDVPF